MNVPPTRPLAQAGETESVAGLRIDLAFGRGQRPLAMVVSASGHGRRLALELTVVGLWPWSSAPLLQAFGRVRPPSGSALSRRPPPRPLPNRPRVCRNRGGDPVLARPKRYAQRACAKTKIYIHSRHLVIAIISPSPSSVRRRRRRRQSIAVVAVVSPSRFALATLGLSRDTTHVASEMVENVVKHDTPSGS